MKYLALALLLCTLLSLSHAFCESVFMEKGMTHCQDITDETWHAVGSSWTNSKCLDCTCSGCCSGYSIPTIFPDYCVKVFDPEVCKYTVYKKDDPSVLCPIYGSVGKWYSGLEVWSIFLWETVRGMQMWSLTGLPPGNTACFVCCNTRPIRKHSCWELKIK